MKSNTHEDFKLIAIEKPDGDSKEGLELKVSDDTHHIEQGHQLLKRHGFDVSTFELLRNQALVEYGFEGLVFIGFRSDGKIGMIDKKLYKDKRAHNKPSEYYRNSSEIGTKRNYPFIIKGYNNEAIEIVEDNFDGLALYEINARDLPADAQPTIIVTAGRSDVKFLTNPDVIEMIGDAKTIRSHGSNRAPRIPDGVSTTEYFDTLERKQLDIDKANLKRLELITAINPDAKVVHCHVNGNYETLIEANAAIKEGVASNNYSFYCPIDDVLEGFIGARFMTNESKNEPQNVKFEPVQKALKCYRL